MKSWLAAREALSNRRGLSLLGRSKPVDEQGVVELDYGAHAYRAV
jgi:hypothetical protein